MCTLEALSYTTEAAGVNERLLRRLLSEDFVARARVACGMRARVRPPERTCERAERELLALHEEGRRARVALATRNYF